MKLIPAEELKELCADARRHLAEGKRKRHVRTVIAHDNLIPFPECIPGTPGEDEDEDEDDDEDDEKAPTRTATSHGDLEEPADQDHANDDQEDPDMTGPIAMDLDVAHGEEGGFHASVDGVGEGEGRVDYDMLPGEEDVSEEDGVPDSYLKGDLDEDLTDFEGDL